MAALWGMAGEMLTAVGWRWTHDVAPDGDDVLRIDRPPNDESMLWHFVWVNEGARSMTFRSLDSREVSQDLYWASVEYANYASVETRLAKAVIFPMSVDAKLRMSYALDPIPQGTTVPDLARLHRVYMIDCIAVSIEFDGVLTDGMEGVDAAAAIPARIEELGRG
jgi:hypothetical protein